MLTLLNWFLWLFGHRVDCGEIALVIDGTKEVEVRLPFTPKKVFIDLRANNFIPVCQGCADSFDLRIIPNGFVLHVHLNSEFREIEWLAIK